MDFYDGLTRTQTPAFDLLAFQGAVRYGTRITEMRHLKTLGICCAYDKGPHLHKGRWVWVPTKRGHELIAEYKRSISSKAVAHA